MRGGSTLNIIVCDDELAFANVLKEKIEKICKGEKINIKVETSGSSLLKNKDLDKLDAVFLDIEMPGMDGIRIADEIRKFNQYVHIVFVSNREELVYQSLVYRPFRFIRKSKMNIELDEALKALVKDIHEGNRYIVIGNSSKSYKVHIADIIYIESSKHDITIHTEEEIICVRDTMTRLEDVLEKYYFIRIHSGYLVNPKYIYSIGTKDVILDNKVELPISRHKIADTKKRFFEYSRRNR